MEKTKGQGARILSLLRILYQMTDDEHGLSMRQLIGELKQSGIVVERKTVYADICLLKEYGFDIVTENNGRDRLYHIAHRHFELPELKLLVDVVQASRFITRKKSERLIRKLEMLASRYEAGQLDRQVYVSGRIKAENESIYYNVDRIHSAIEKDVRIHFQYFQWTVEKEKQLRHHGRVYQVSPWALTWDNECYYLVGYDEELEEIRHYRVDKMLHIDLTDIPRKGKKQFEDFDLAEYTQRCFGMFGGEERTVVLRVKNEFAGVIYDRFGTELEINRVGDDCFEVGVEVAVSDQFFGWIISLGDKVKIVGPEEAVVRMREIGEQIRSEYGKMRKIKKESP